MGVKKVNLQDLISNSPYSVTKSQTCKSSESRYAMIMKTKTKLL